MMTDALLSVPGDEQESCPTTPVNRNFPLDLDPTFATAILSPSSTEVFAARTRARSRSEVYLGKAFTLTKRASLSKDRESASQSHKTESVHHFDAQNSSVDHSLDTIDHSFSTLKLDTPNTSVETSITESVENACAPDAAEDLLKLRVPNDGQWHTLRRKSNTISMPVIKAPKFQDVFGPTVPIDQNNNDDARKTTSPPIGRAEHPRRMTISAPTSILKTGKSHESLRKRQSLRIIVEPQESVTAPSPHLTPVAQLTPARKLRKENSGLREVAYRKSRQYGDEQQPHQRERMSGPSSEDDSINAFQQLIQGMAKERPTHTAILSEVSPVDQDSLGAVLEYRRSSPTSTPAKGNETQTLCQLCGAVARRLTILEPCGHFACAACCSSGLNQVTATPPRPHVCAACHTHVQGITLRKCGESLKTGYDSFPSSSPRLARRPQTPTVEEQSMLYTLCATSSSSPEQQRLLPYREAELMKPTRSTSDGMDPFCVQGSDECTSFTENEGLSEGWTEDGSFLSLDRAKQPLPVKIDMLSDMSEEKDRDMFNPPEHGSTAIVRMDNIPWTVSYTDIVAWLPSSANDTQPGARAASQAIHIPIDVVSGKTANCCFIECRSKGEAMKLVRHRNNSRLLGRPVTLILTSRDDLLNEIFPFRITSPRKEDEHCLFFTPGILGQMVSLLKNGSTQLKGPAKVIDLATSMVCLVPPMLIAPLREILFERIKEIICTCIMASHELLDLHDSLNRLVSASSCCACFTVLQRIDILESARRALQTVSHRQ